MTHYSHCLFLHRHVYQYIVFWDTDEFIILKEDFKSLPALLDFAFAQNQEEAAAVFYRYAYRSGCNLTSHAQSDQVTQYHHQFDHREQDPESARLIKRQNWEHLLTGRGDKLVVRPLLVDEFYFHWLHSARANYSREGVVIPAKQAYLKHIRRYKGFDSCGMLVAEDPS